MAKVDTLELKTVEIEGKTYAEINADGRVLYNDDGKEFAFDAKDTYAKIKQLNGESMSLREAKQKLESDYSELSSKLEGVDLSKMVDAGKIDEVKAEIAKSYQEKINQLEEANQGLIRTAQEKDLARAFSDSEFIRENLTLPSQIARDTFSKNIAQEDGKMIVKDNDGNAIFSRQKPGEYAGFDEGLSILVDGLPFRDKIMKARNHQGTGGDANGGQARTIKRSEFDGMSATEKASTAKSISEGTVTLVE